MTKLTLDQACKIIDGALQAGHEKGLRPLTVAVLDEGGSLKAFKKEDNSSLLRFEIAFGKAWGALGMGCSSRAINKMADERPSFVAAVATASGGRLVPVPGGVLIRDGSGEVLGAVGVSGDISDNDEAVALAGIKAAGLQPGQT